MELRVLNYYLTVAREGSFNAAAESLHLSQPTLSRQIKDMEDELGKQLIIRGNKRITLTDEGVILRKRAQEILELVDKTESEVVSFSEDISGEVRIGAGETDAVHFIAEAAMKLHEQYPNTCFRISSGDTQDLSEELDKGLIDFALIFDQADESKYHVLELPEQARWGLLMRRDHPLASADGIKNTDLWDIPLIVSRQIPEDGLLSRWIGKSISELDVVATYSLLYNASVLAAAGLGCVLCIDKIINTSGSSELTFVPLAPEFSAGMKIIWKKYQIFSKVSELFLAELKARITSH